MVKRMLQVHFWCCRMLVNDQCQYHCPMQLQEESEGPEAKGLGALYSDTLKSVANSVPKKVLKFVLFEALE